MKHSIMKICLLNAVRKGFHDLKDREAKALYLFAVATVLGKSEILNLLKYQVEMELMPSFLSV